MGDLAGISPDHLLRVTTLRGHLGATLDTLAEQPADFVLYTGKPRQELNQLMMAQGESKNELQKMEEEWLMLQEELEAMNETFEG